MEINFILYGFIGEINNFHNLKESFRICNNIDDLKINFFYSIPNKSSEFSEHEITEDLIKSIVGDNFNFKFELREYNPCQYIRYSIELGYPQVIWEKTSYKLYPYRSLSMLDSIKKSFEIVDKHSDITIISRLDFLPLISIIPKISLENIKNKIYLYRTVPYKLNDDVEDRILWGDTDKIKIISKIYDDKDILISDEIMFYNEQIISRYFKKNSDAELLFQDGIDIETKINEKKYSEDVQNRIKILYDNCK